METGGVYGALANRMNYLVARQGVIAGNIANADTPGYLEQDLTFSPKTGSFGAVLAQAKTSSMHMGGGEGNGDSAGRMSKSGLYIQHNGNAVRLDNEMQKMNQTSLEYQMMTQLYTKQIGLQKMALGRN